MRLGNYVGQQFGNYHLTQFLGSGGYAEVYLAEHIHVHPLQYAIKILAGTDLLDAQRALFLQEARTIANLQRLNDHIVQIRDFDIQVGMDNGVATHTPYIVMEYAPEGTLRDRYPLGTKVPLERIVFYINQIAGALQTAHEQNPPIVHRDIKPENMLLRRFDHALLSDFGIAINSMSGPLRPAPQESIILGTPYYLAPERIQGFTRRASDQYSLGVVVYEWISGRRLFHGTEREVCYMHENIAPPPLYPNCPWITPEIEAVVMRALAKRPEDRFPSIKEFARALDSAVSLANAPLPPLTRPPIPPPPAPPQPPPVMPGKKPGPKKRHAASGLHQLSLPTHRYSLFRLGGLLLNVLAAFLISMYLQNSLTLIMLLLFSSLIFALYTVTEALALLLKVLVALYWAGIGWVAGTALAQLQHYNGPLLALFGCILFLAVNISLQFIHGLANV